MEYGLDLLKRCFCFALRNPGNLSFSEGDCHPTLKLTCFVKDKQTLKNGGHFIQIGYFWVHRKRDENQSLTRHHKKNL